MRGNGGWHSHEDGAIHTHWFSRRRHRHPTLLEQWDAFLTRVVGPAPEDVQAARRARRLYS